jgi:hypothetical protein
VNHSPTHVYQQGISDATDALKAAHEQLARSANVLARARSDLATRENEVILAGVEGKNEAERKARLADLTTADRVRLEDAERNHRGAQLAVTLAELDHKLARELAALHRAELTSRGGIE